MKKKLRIIIGLMTIALALSVFYFNQEPSNASAEGSVTDTTALEIEEPKMMFGFPLDSFEVISDRIKSNEFLANILLKWDVDYATIDALAKKSKEVFDVRKMNAGKPYHVFLSKDSLAQVYYFVYQPNAIDYVVYDLRDSILIYTDQKEVEIKEQNIAGIINNSLYVSLQEANASPALAVGLSEIFAWAIDFYRIQKGDWFKVVYEEKFVEDESIGIGEIKAVEFNHYNNTYYAFHFEQGEKDDYFDEEANSLRKAFLKSPLKFSRLSSRYTMRRFHPVQKRWKAHLGTDYAAPTGTPIMSTGDGVVIESRYKRANGNYVKVKHNSVYTTQYLHMSKRKAKVGDYVKQGDIIGYVGSTGLATGPHVCYRFWKNGKQVDHLRQDFPSAEPVKEEFIPAFDSLKRIYTGQLKQLIIEKES